MKKFTPLVLDFDSSICIGEVPQTCASNTAISLSQGNPSQAAHTTDLRHPSQCSKR